MLCLTERYDSLPMWAHYADRAKGAIVIFEGLDDIFAGDSTGALNVLRRVQYYNDRPGINFDPDSHENLFFSKVSDWEYEREVRIVTPLDECSNLGGLFVREIDEKYVVGVICGWRMSEGDRAALRGLSNRKEVYAAHYDGRNVVVDPVNLPCSNA
jgi:hypothetical protein